VTVLLPDSLDRALQQLAAEPGAHVLAGGTDFMVEVNYGHRRPETVLSLRRLGDLRTWHVDGSHVVLGACVTHSQLLEPALADLLPGLAQAARTVGSPQIRSTGTIGGNVSTASPAGDTLPVLAALDAEVVLAAATGERTLPLTEFVTGPKRTVRRADELLVAVRVPVATGPQEYLKVGVRNAMVIAVASAAVVVDHEGRTVRAALGSCGPAPVRCHDAEAWLAPLVDWDAGRIDDPRTYEAFGVRCAEAARPIDDHRSSAAYRSHACRVLARRALARCL
jgi:CO/xanthine dehydrogenase FAD-binding subunit